LFDKLSERTIPKLRPVRMATRQLGDRNRQVDFTGKDGIRDLGFF
jgi:hypothetical protein